MKLNTMKQEEDLRGVFFIIKGQYKHHLSPTFINEVTGSEMCLGGYDPDQDTTPEWYMVVDRYNYHCIYCGVSLEGAKKSIVTAIRKYKTLGGYNKMLNRLDRSQAVSKPMRCLYKEIEKTFGDYYLEDIEDMEDQAYDSVVFKTPLQRSKDIKRKSGVKKLGKPLKKVAPKKEEVKPLLKKGKTKRPIRKLALH